MSERNKNGNDRLSDFLRYRENKMTDRERNSFERSLQKDAFAREASEGLENIDTSLAGDDLTRLRKQLRKRTIRKQRVLWYSIAASAALLIVVSSIFIFTDRRNNPEQLSYAPVTQQSEDLQALKNQPQTETKALSTVPVEKEKTASPGPERIIPPPSNAILSEKKSDKRVEINKDEVSVENMEIMEVAEVAEPDQVFVAEKALPSRSVRTKKISDTITESKPDTSDISLSEVVVVGYGARGTDKEAEEDVNQYNPPYPINGRADFDKYIRENIRRPDTTTAGQRVVVVLNFRIDAEGNIDSIRIIRSPGKIFSDEAIRLIREGPGWKPAEENGKSINDEVRIRIVFK